ncbi:MAG: hypothetical protein QOH05_2504, partial [Acetobacteraceae bacterium]|nr:hypothetical protein [Acetobacteraceae bacterium]
MKSRLILAVATSLALAGSPVLAPVASAQAAMPMPAEQGGGAGSYIVPVVVGVIVGALVWPLIVPAAADAAIVGGAGGAA